MLHEKGRTEMSFARFPRLPGPAMRDSAFHKSVLLRAALVFCLLFPGAVSAGGQNGPNNTRVIVGYFPEWGPSSQYYVKNVITSGSAPMLTIIGYVFANVVNNKCGIADANADYDQRYTAANSVDGTDDPTTGTGVFGSFHQLQELKAKYPNLKLLISLGGAKLSGGFSSAAQPANVAGFVASCIDMFIQGNIAPGVSAPGLFDGIDIDWEWPASTEASNYINMLSMFRSQLDGTRPNLLLTIAGTPGTWASGPQPLSNIHGYLNYINVEAYGYAGPWESTANFVAPLYGPAGSPTAANNVDATIQEYLAAGVPASKLLLGVPFFAHDWTNVPNQKNGLFQTGTPDPAGGTYAHIVQIMPNFHQFREPLTQEPWLFNGNTFWTFDDPTSITLKMNYVKSRGLAGAMIWNLGQDTPSGTLIQSVNQGLINQPLQFMPASPCRLADTRNPNGPFGWPLLSGGAVAREFDIPTSSCNIPATAQAYSLNVTVVPQSGSLGFLTIFPCGQPQPATSTLNSQDGRVKAVAAIVPAGINGGVCAFATNDTHLILDINGYFVPASNPSSLAFYPVAPCRLVDTREPAGPLGGPSLAGGSSRTFPIRSAGTCNLPTSAQAYSLNFTAVAQGNLGFLTAWPGGQAQPLVSTLNAPTGTTTANAAIVPAGTNGDIAVFASNNTDLVIDVNGYFAPPGQGGLSLFTLPPCRVLDTRASGGSFNGTLSFNVAAANCAAPATAPAYVLNATVVPQGSLGFLTLWATGGPQPLVSTLNAVDGAVTSNMAIVPDTNGSVTAFASNPTQLILDVLGYFAP